MKPAIKKPLMIVGVATSLAASGFMAGGLAHADTTTSTTGNDSLISKIAKKFNLNESDVKAVFDQDRSEHQTHARAQVEKDLTQAVKDGKITADQKTKILAKRAELQAQRDADRTANKNQTPEERHTAMQQKRTELEQWAKDNGIPTQYLRYVVGHGGRGHMDMDR